VSGLDEGENDTRVYTTVIIIIYPLIKTHVLQWHASSNDCLRTPRGLPSPNQDEVHICVPLSGAFKALPHEMLTVRPFCLAFGPNVQFKIMNVVIQCAFNKQT